MTAVTVLGGGSWGTALAVLLSARWERVRLWVRSPDLAATLTTLRENPGYLPGVVIPNNVSITASLALAVEGAEMLVCAVPSHAVRRIFSALKLARDLPVVSATKGIEPETLLRMSQVIWEAAGSNRIAVLTGPSFALEAATGHPTAVVVASQDTELSTFVQMALSGDTFRVYTSSDPVGAELGGAFKNVVAIGAGILSGSGLGQNAVAALITRGLAEMTRLAVRMGGEASTLAGLAGLGDLVLTCTGSMSRNRRVGEQLALGMSLADISSRMNMVAEGVPTTRSIVKLGDLHAVELPIAQQMDAVLYRGRPVREAIQILMGRSLKNEY